MIDRHGGFSSEHPGQLLESAKENFKNHILENELLELLLLDLLPYGPVVEPFFGGDTAGIIAHYQETLEGEREGGKITKTVTRHLVILCTTEESVTIHPSFEEEAAMFGYSTPEELTAITQHFENAIERTAASVPPHFLEIDHRTQTWQLATDYR